MSSSRALVSLSTSVQSVIDSIDTPEKAAQVFADNEQTFKDVQTVWYHVKNKVELAARVHGIPVEGGSVAAVPNGYDYDLAVARQLAPESVKRRTVAPPFMLRINELALQMTRAVQELFTQADLDMPIDRESLSAIRDACAEVAVLSQASDEEYVDANTLRAILGRGDQRAIELSLAGVKIPKTYRIVVRHDT